MLNDFASRHNCIIGVCDATPLAREPYAAGFVPFVSKDLEKRTNPAAALSRVRSIIVVGFGNPGTKRGGSSPAESIKKYSYRAELSSLGQNADYHKRVKVLLLDIAEELHKHFSINYKILVDNPGLDERAFAVRAGLGFYGRHGLVVSEKFGSRFHIGLLLTDIPLNALNPAWNPAEAHGNPSIEYPLAGCTNRADSLPLRGIGFAGECPPDCRRCIDACPTGALSPSRGFDVSRCISYLTQNDELTPEEETLLGNQLYGCDICQDACPFNAPRGKTWVDPHDWLAMSDDDFDRAYGHTAMLWRGAEILRRNARVIIKARL
ncbi:MAG: DUF1730 domain-containing protein [Defluviitaleaceae bacterium]|nr:DUF1730 domain-containing protein [Defluviitaleaceae bacterium]